MNEGRNKWLAKKLRWIASMAETTAQRLDGWRFSARVKEGKNYEPFALPAAAGGPIMNTFCTNAGVEVGGRFGPDIERLLRENSRKVDGLSAAQLKIIAGSKITRKQLNEIGRRAGLIQPSK